MSLIYFITLFLVGATMCSLIIGMLMIYRYTERTLSHRVLMFSAFTWLVFGIWFLIHYFYPDPYDTSERILSLPFLICGIVTGFASMAYPVTVMCNQRLRRRILWFFMLFTLLPVLIYTILYLFTGRGLEQYSNYSEVQNHWFDLSVILRLWFYLITVLYNVTIFGLVLRLLPVYEAYVTDTYSDLNYNLQWLRVAAVFYVGISLVFTLCIFWYSEWTRLVYIVVDFPLWLLLLNQAIFNKSFLPSHDFEVAWSWKRGWYEQYKEKPEEIIPLNIELLIRRLVSHMETSFDFTNSNLTRDDFAKVLHTNRTTLSRAIRQLGYESFQDYINKQRIAYFKKLAYANPYLSVATLCRMSGFSSRTTFYNYFRQVEGILPAKYMENINAEIQS